jgi:hypothetical protein
MTISKSIVPPRLLGQEREVEHFREIVDAIVVTWHNDLRWFDALRTSLLSP